MKNKNKTEVLILVLGITFALSIYSKWAYINIQLNNKFIDEFQNESILINPKLSGYWELNFIHIDENWSSTAGTYQWCNGDGSWNNPYTIENVTIDASSSPTGSGIFINNSKNEYFIIRNCTVHNAQSGTYDAGIKLENTNNGSLILNNCSNNENVGILLQQNCSNNTLSENIANNKGTASQIRGIFLQINCHNNILSGNTANDNIEYGIIVYDNSNNNKLTGNTASDNDHCGILFNNGCNNNSISKNIANDNIHYGIHLSNNCDNNTLMENTISNVLKATQDKGIYLNLECDNNTIYENTANDNLEYGIFLETNCDNNKIVGNTANNNDFHGIYLYNQCHNNTISGNIASNNIGTIQNIGIYLYQCDNNIILKNTASNNSYYGIYLNNQCYNNTISRNTARKNTQYGIYIINQCNSNTISGNIIYENNGGIIIFSTCNNNLIYNNCLSYNSWNNAEDNGTNYWDNGIFGNYWTSYIGIDANLDGIGDSAYNIPGTGTGKDNKPLMNYEPIYHEIPEDISCEIGSIGNILKWTLFDISPFLESYNILRDGISIKSSTLNKMQSEIFVNIDGLDAGNYIFTLEIDHGYGAPASYSVLVDINNTAPKFTVKPNDFSYEVGKLGNNLLWTFSDVSTNNPTYTIKRNNLPLIISEPCVSGETINISADELNAGLYCFEIEVNDGYGGIIQDTVWITVKSSSDLNMTKQLYVDVINQLFSLQDFIFTFVIYNENNHGINSAIIQMWWNETNVSTDIQTLGNGLYFIALDPITVEPGDDPISLEMEISAPGYQDKSFITYIAVDPDTLEKNLAGRTNNLPLILTITIISSIVGIVGVTATTLFILHKRKQVR
ncbi:MAG: right-handed parallel beta-helix repeat-containing protein [Candidatus Odinarchaeota archaeon]